MVTKHILVCLYPTYSLILAKNHMVTKQMALYKTQSKSLILAKNHMVTKLNTEVD